jgi:hypothetical protein
VVPRVALCAAAAANQQQLVCVPAPGTPLSVSLSLLIINYCSGTLKNSCRARKVKLRLSAAESSNLLIEEKPNFCVRITVSLIDALTDKLTFKPLKKIKSTVLNKKLIFYIDYGGK